MWIKANPNPLGKETSDCVIRAICIALNKPWMEVFDELTSLARRECSMPSDNNVWGLLLYLYGFEPFLIPSICPRCITIDQFTKEYPYGTYIIGTGSHAVCIINGNWCRLVCFLICLMIFNLFPESVGFIF